MKNIVKSFVVIMVTDVEVYQTLDDYMKGIDTIYELIKKNS